MRRLPGPVHAMHPVPGSAVLPQGVVRVAALQRGPLAHCQDPNRRQALPVRAGDLDPLPTPPLDPLLCRASFSARLTF
eukprot:427561-Prorocentrum_minimum.AAC.3